MSSCGNVAVFWDLETCSPEAGDSGYTLVENIRNIAHEYGSVTTLKGYLDMESSDVFARSMDVRSELQTSGVSVTDCPRVSGISTMGQMITVDMLTYAYECVSPGSDTTIMLISSDPCLAYTLSTMRLRKHSVVLVCPSETHAGLRAHVSRTISWDVEVLKQATDLEETPQRPSRSPQPRLASSYSTSMSEVRTNSGSESNSVSRANTVVAEVVPPGLVQRRLSHSLPVRPPPPNIHPLPEKPLGYTGMGSSFNFFPNQSNTASDPSWNPTTATASPSAKLNSLASPFTPSSNLSGQRSEIPTRWKLLVSILEEKRKALGQRQIIRFDVAGCLSRYKMKEIYKMAGVSSYADWVDAAEKDGIVETGGDGNARWLALRPEWMAAASRMN